VPGDAAAAAAPVEARFLQGRRGRIFSVLYRPPGEVRAAVLFVHGWAEELTKARHMVARAARRLAADGLAVQMVDLFGCGDSEGMLAEADLETWQGDLQDCMQALARRFEVPVHLWGLRLGGLLAARLARDAPAAATLMLWQPPAQGRIAINEFLRLRTAGGLLRGADRESVDGLREHILAGEPVEIAGFVPGAAAFGALDALTLAELAPAGWRCVWLEVARDPARPLAPALGRARDAWEAAGVPVEVVRVAGVPFWGSGELQLCPPLIDATAEVFARQ